MYIDHIGIVVKNIIKGIEHWNFFFDYEQHTEIIINSVQSARIVFLKKKNSLSVKLVEPLDETSPVWKFAKKGGGLHHLCFKTENIYKEIEILKNKGMRLLSAPAPGEAFDNEDIAFLYAKQGLKIEIIDTDKKALILND